MTIRNSFTAVLMLLAFINYECLAADNALIGSWKWDNSRTLREFVLPTGGSEKLKSDAAKAKRFVEAKVKQLGSNMTLTYTVDECLEIVFDDKGNVLSRESFPYKTVEIGEDFVILDQLKNGGIVKAFLKGDSF